MKVVIMGGSAPSTPWLFRFLASSPRLSSFEFVLLGRTPHRLEAVARAARLVAVDAIKLKTAIICPSEVHLALHDAEVVIIQVRVGGFSGRIHDETFPLEFALCGDEGLGPGGLAAAWRSWPVIRELLVAIASVSPHALVLMLSSPVTLLVRLANIAFPQLHVAGVCELPFTTLQSICTATGTDFEFVDYSYIGINHLGWFHSIRNGSKNLIPAYAATRPSRSKEQSPFAVEFPSRELVESLNAVPLKYLRLQYQPDEVLAEQKQQLRSRGEILREIQNRAINVFRECGTDEILDALAWRPADWYQQSVGPLLLALAGERVPAHIFLSSRVEEPFGPFEIGDVEERAYVVRDGQFQPRGRSIPPSALAALLTRFVDSDRVAACAVLERSPELLIRSLRLHPWTARHPSLDGIVQRIIQNA